MKLPDDVDFREYLTRDGSDRPLFSLLMARAFGALRAVFFFLPPAFEIEWETGTGLLSSGRASLPPLLILKGLEMIG